MLVFWGVCYFSSLTILAFIYFKQVKSKSYLKSLYQSKTSSVKTISFIDFLAIRRKWGKIKLYLVTSIPTVVFVFGAVIMLVYFLNSVTFNFPLYVHLPFSVIVSFLVVLVKISNSRRNEFEIEFMKCIEIFIASVSSGMTIANSIYEVGQQNRSMLGQSFKDGYARLSVGEHLGNIFTTWQKLFPYKEMYYLCMLLKISEDTGSDLKYSLVNLKSLVVKSQKFNKQKSAKTAEVRMSAKVLVVIPILFIVFIKYMDPTGFEMLITSGKFVFYTCVTTIIVGVLIIWYMLRGIK